MLGTPSVLVSKDAVHKHKSASQPPILPYAYTSTLGYEDTNRVGIEGSDYAARNLDD